LPFYLPLQGCNLGIKINDMLLQVSALDYGLGSATVCELSLDPEVAILFGREIRQSNDDILLTIYDDSKDKSRLVTCVAKCCL
jgi:hypothetical protein